MRWGIIVFLLLVAVVGGYFASLYIGSESIGAGSEQVEAMAKPEFTRWLGIPILGDAVGAVSFSAQWIDNFFEMATKDYGFLSGPMSPVQIILIVLVAGIGIWLFFSRVAGRA